jgi:hypothetical protein
MTFPTTLWYVLYYLGWLLGDGSSGARVYVLFSCGGCWVGLYAISGGGWVQRVLLGWVSVEKGVFSGTWGMESGINSGSNGYGCHCGKYGLPLRWNRGLWRWMRFNDRWVQFGIFCCISIFLGEL